jgi:hypothetical protein
VPSRRLVVTTPDFYAHLDLQLPAEREGATPSRHDFLAYVMPVIIEQFETGWDDLPQRYAGRDTYRVVIVAGVLVPAVVVYGQETRSGAIELVEVEIDLDGLPDPDPDE